MTWAVNHPHRRQRVGSVTWASTRTTTRPVRVPWVGLFIALLGAWGGIVAFVGPAFGYHATTTSSWQWTTTNWLLHLIPGAMALVAGLAILGWAPSWATFKARGALAFAALLAIVAGAWFVVGPALWPWFQSSAPYGPYTDPLTSFVNQVGANLGPGVLLCVLGGMALKTALSARHMAVGTGPVAGAPGAVGDYADGPAGNGREDVAAPMTSDQGMTSDRTIASDRGMASDRTMAENPGVADRTVAGDPARAPAARPDDNLPPA